MNCRNGARFLRPGLESLLAQSFEDWELIFFDNCSVDESRDIVTSFGEDRFEIISSKEPLPLGRARAEALSHAGGEFVGFLDTDDEWLPNKLEDQVVTLSSSEAAVSYGDFFIDDLEKGTRRLAYGPGLPRGDVLVQLLRHYRVGFLTALVRREALNKVPGGFGAHYDLVHDFDLMLRLAAIGTFESETKPLAVYRRHPTSETGRNTFRHAMELKALSNEVSTSPLFSDCREVWRVGELAKFKSVEAHVRDNHRIRALGQAFRMRPTRELAKAIAISIFPSSLTDRAR